MTTEHAKGERAAIAIDRVSMRYQTTSGAEVEALREVSFGVGVGEFVSIVGASGCGKTTLLRIVDGLLAPTAGTIAVNGVPVTGPGPERAFVFQQDALFPWRTVWKNVAFGLELHAKSAAANERVRELLRIVGLTGFEHLHPHELSGGMRQRANLARAFAVDPAIFLMDEPFGSLDAQTREIMQFELLKIWSQSGKTVLFVTHQIEEAIYLSDRVVVLSSRPGQIKAIVAVDLPRPRELAIKRTPEFGRLVASIWDLIEKEVQASLFVREG